MAYPIFDAPEIFAMKPPREWSQSEAKSYFDWVMNSADERVNYLLEFLNLRHLSEPEVILHEAQIRLEALLNKHEFSTDTAEGKGLTKQGRALAADMGLLTAKLILQATGKRVHWQIVARPKSDVSFNLPVLSGFGGATYNPIGVSIADTSWILLGNHKPDAWVKAYQYAVGKALAQ